MARTRTRAPLLDRGGHGLGVLAAVAAGLAAWGLGTVGGADYLVTDPRGTSRVDLIATAATAAVVAAAGWVALVLLEGVTRYAREIWTVVAVVVLAVSLVPVFLAEASVPTRAGLVLIHLAVGGTLLAALRR